MPIYASPEIWREELYQAKADIWSLGCILYELCTLKHPFRAEDMDSTFRKISKGFFQRIPAHFSAELGQLLKATLQTSATSRASCEKILQFLKNARFCRKLQENNRGFLLKTLRILHSLFLKATPAIPKSKTAIISKKTTTISL